MQHRRNTLFCGARNCFFVSKVKIFYPKSSISAPINSRPNVVVRSPTRLDWVKMAVGLPEGSTYPWNSPSFFRYASPWTAAEGQHTASLKSVACFFFSFLLPFSCPSSSPRPSPSLDERKRSSQPWPHLSLLCVRWKCDLAGRVSAMLHLLQMGPSKVLTTFPLQIQNSWSCPPAVSPFVTLCLSPRTSPTCIPPLCNLTLRLLKLHSLPTLVLKPLIPRQFIQYLPPRPILYLLPLPPHHCPFLLAVLLRILPPLPPDSLRVLQWNAGDLRARSTELLHFLSSHSVDLICIQESNLNSSSSVRIFWILCSAFWSHPLPVWHVLLCSRSQHLSKQLLLALIS